MKRIFLFLAAAACLPSLWALDAAEIAAQLQQQGEVQGDFVQSRHLRGIKEPVESGGRFELSPDTLYWHMETPFAVSLRITADGVAQWHEGEWRSGSDGQLQEAQTRLFLAFLRGDMKTLREYFSLSANGTAEKWRLTLKPATDIMRRIFKRIDIHGGEAVQRVVIEETQGDRSEITFTLRR